MFRTQELHFTGLHFTLLFIVVFIWIYCLLLVFVVCFLFDIWEHTPVTAFEYICDLNVKQSNAYISCKHRKLNNFNFREDHLIPDAPFFTKDVYDKCSLAPSVRELWTFLQWYVNILHFHLNFYPVFKSIFSSHHSSHHFLPSVLQIMLVLKLQRPHALNPMKTQHTWKTTVASVWIVLIVTIQIQTMKLKLLKHVKTRLKKRKRRRRPRQTRLFSQTLDCPFLVHQHCPARSKTYILAF